MRIKNIDITYEDVSLYVPTGETYSNYFNKYLQFTKHEDEYEKVYTIRLGKHRLLISVEKPAIKALYQPPKLDKVA